MVSLLDLLLSFAGWELYISRAMPFIVVMIFAFLQLLVQAYIKKKGSKGVGKGKQPAQHFLAKEFEFLPLCLSFSLADEWYHEREEKEEEKGRMADVCTESFEENRR